MSAQSTIPAVPPSPLLQAKLDQLRRRHLRVAVGAGLAKIVVVLLPLLALEMVLDYWLDFSWALRAGLFCVLAALACALAARRLVRPWLHRPDDDTLALMVEKRLPSFHTRLIAAIQLTRPAALPPGAAASLVTALVSETEILARPVEFSSIVPTNELKKFSAWAVAALLAGLVALGAGGQDARDLLKRAFLSQTPVPRKTRVIVVEGDKRIGRGDSVVIEAVGQGLLPSRGTLVVKSLLRRGQEFVMERATNAPNRYTRSLENVQQSFSYVVELGDDASRTHHVEVIPRPSVVSLQCQQVYPPYTGLPPAKRAPGDLVLLAGSTLEFTATASKPLQKATAKLDGVSQDLPLTVSSKDPRQATGQIRIPAKDLTGFSLHVLDAAGLDSRDPAVYPIEILPDKAPTVRLLAPERKEELVTQVATVFVEFQAQDDFQVARAWLRYKLGEADNAPTNSVELDLAGAEAAQVRRTFPWKITSITPSVTLGTRVEFWIEATDNNDVTGPGRSASDHQLLRVVTPDEKRADLLTRAGDYLGAISDVAGDQERLNQNLGAIILEKRRP